MSSRSRTPLNSNRTLICVSLRYFTSPTLTPEIPETDTSELPIFSLNVRPWSVSVTVLLWRVASVKDAGLVTVIDSIVAVTGSSVVADLWNPYRTSMVSVPSRSKSPLNSNRTLISVSLRRSILPVPVWPALTPQMPENNRLEGKT